MKTDSLVKKLEAGNEGELKMLREEVSSQLDAALTAKEELTLRSAALQEQLKLLDRRLGKHVVPMKSWREEAVITDHAVVRYMERFCGFDIKGLRKRLREMLPELVPENSEFVLTKGVCLKVVYHGPKTYVTTVVKRTRGFNL